MKRVFVKRVNGQAEQLSCEGQGCPNDAVWRIGVPAAVIFLCERCLAEVRDTVQAIRAGRT